MVDLLSGIESVLDSIKKFLFDVGNRCHLLRLERAWPYSPGAHLMLPVVALDVYKPLWRCCVLLWMIDRFCLCVSLLCTRSLLPGLFYFFFFYYWSLISMDLGATSLRMWEATPDRGKKIWLPIAVHQQDGRKLQWNVEWFGRDLSFCWQ